MAETKQCVDCKQEFPVNEHGDLVVPYFDIHSTMCERCGVPLVIEYKEDGSIHYSCPSHRMLEVVCSQFYGRSSTYCPFCYEKRRKKNKQAYPICPICSTSTPVYKFLDHYQGYTLFGGGTAIRICCRKCEAAFLALSASNQSFYIRQRCELAFPRGQVIYNLVDPESHLVRYIGRTHDLKKRFQRHLSERSNVPAVLNEKPYYSRPNWMHDMHSKGLRPTEKILKEVEIAPTAIEWETRYILHGFQQDWPLTNIESAIEELVAKARASQLDFLRCSFESLVHERFVSDDGIEAFVRKFYL